jgi:hypothetical protein
MSHHFKLNYVCLVAALAVAGCASEVPDQTAAADKSRAVTPDTATKGTTQAPPKPISSDAAAPTGESDKKEKEKRGNTPPGTDRSGGGPASGAIVDPTGVMQK